jgi:hypothetical protein
LPFSPVNNDYNILRLPYFQRNNEEYFIPGTSAALCSDTRYRQFICFPGIKDQYEPYPPFPAHKGSYGPLPPFRVSDDYGYHTTKHQFAPVPTESNPPSFEDSKNLQVSSPSSLVEVSFIPSISFTLQDVTQLDSPSAGSEDPVTIAQNMTHASGAVLNR